MANEIYSDGKAKQVLTQAEVEMLRQAEFCVVAGEHIIKEGVPDHVTGVAFGILPSCPTKITCFVTNHRLVLCDRKGALGMVTLSGYFKTKDIDFQVLWNQSPQITVNSFLFGMRKTLSISANGEKRIFCVDSAWIDAIRSASGLKF